MITTALILVVIAFLGGASIVNTYALAEPTWLSDFKHGYYDGCSDGLTGVKTIVFTNQSTSYMSGYNHSVHDCIPQVHNLHIHLTY